MTQISIEDVQHLAQLSSLELDDGEVESLRTDIENIVNYVGQLSELDTSNVEPTYQVTGLKNVWREDIVDDYGVDGSELLNLAPESKDSQIKVPKVL